MLVHILHCCGRGMPSGIISRGRWLASPSRCLLIMATGTQDRASRRRRVHRSPSSRPGDAAQQQQQSPSAATLELLDERFFATPRLAAAVLAVGAATGVTSAASRSAFSGSANQRGALQDRMHEWVGYCDQAGQSTALGSCPPHLAAVVDMLPDKLALVALTLTLALFVGGAWRHRNIRVFFKLLSESLALWALLLVLRATTVSATIMPAPSPLCRDASSWEIGPGGRPTKGWFITPIDCNDAMFSGHTSTYSVLLVFWSQSYLPRWTKFLWFCFFMLCCFVSFATRDHYTSDVLVVRTPTR